MGYLSQTLQQKPPSVAIFAEKAVLAVSRPRGTVEHPGGMPGWRGAKLR